MHNKFLLKCDPVKNVIYHMAPVLTGIKPAELVPVKETCRVCKVIQPLIKSCGLFSLRLKRQNGVESLLIYDKERLAAVLSEPLALNLLAGEGYGGLDMDKMLLMLSKHFSLNEFPHEIGLFLGYPPVDVKQFIEQKGRGGSCCRYWKVYHDEAGAVNVFRQIDLAREKAATLIRHDNPAEHIIQSLRAV